MPKILKKVFSAVFGALLLFVTALRCVQLFCLTDISTGFINRNAAGTIALFFALCFALMLILGILLKKGAFKNPFHKSKSRLLFNISIAAGIAMFYDFVYKCVICCKYIAEASSFRLNYFIPACLGVLSALLCTIYFVMMGVSFKTDHYDFKSFKYYHIVPVLWILFSLFSSLSDYNDGIYAEEKMLYYLVLIFGMLFFAELIRCIHSDYKKLKLLCFWGFAYAMLCFVLSVPRMIGFVFGAALTGVDFSVITYLFMSVFAASFSFSMIKLKEE